MLRLYPKNFFSTVSIVLLGVVSSLALVSKNAQAESPRRSADVRIKDFARTIFPPGAQLRDFDTARKFNKPLEIQEEADSAPRYEPIAGAANGVVAPSEAAPEPRKSQMQFVSDAPGAQAILPPDQTPSVRVNPDAPSPILGLVEANRAGDKTTAALYANQFVRYVQDYFFEVREVAQLIGAALVEEKAIDEDDWFGVEQYMDAEMAKTREEKGEVLKPTHEAALRQISPDPKGEAHVYYFFSLNCSWCRYMAPDVERLWRVVQKDPRVRMTALTIGPASKEWLAEYRGYTGLNAPVFDGSELARVLGLSFVPAVVIISPNGNRTYLKTGQQTFDRMYSFLKTVQGEPTTLTPEAQQIVSTPIGQAEAMKGNVTVAKVDYRDAVQTGTRKVSLPHISQPKVSVEKF